MTKFTVPDMSCGHCTAAIEKEIKGVDKGAEISCDLSDHCVTIQSSLDNETILAAIKEAGYEVAIIQ